MVESTAPVIRTRRWLWVEFIALYVGVPTLIAVALPPDRLFLSLAVFCVCGLLLLWFTGGFDWRSLLNGRFTLWQAAAFTAFVGAVSYVFIMATRPEAAFGILRRDPAFLPLIWVLYPILSALPQELIFRVLFFHRYAPLMPNRQVAVAANAVLFSLAHLMYWSPVVMVFTLAGGWIFAMAYLNRGFLWAWTLHALAGNALFTVGMGVYFYSGNVVRPF